MELVIRFGPCREFRIVDPVVLLFLDRNDYSNIPFIKIELLRVSGTVFEVFSDPLFVIVSMKILL